MGGAMTPLAALHAAALQVFKILLMAAAEAIGPCRASA